mgnify:CR=1 FL=1
MRRSMRRFSRCRPVRSRARWATFTRSATRTTGWIPTTASVSRKSIRRRSCRSSGRTIAPTSRCSWPASNRVSTVPKKLHGDADGAVLGHQGRDLPSIVSELRRAVRTGRHRLRRAAARAYLPTPQHTLDLINEMKRQGVETGCRSSRYFDLKTPNAIGRETGAQVLVMLPSVGGNKDVTGLFQAVRLRRSTCWSKLSNETGAK